MSLGRKIMILGGGVLQVPAIIRAKELGLEVIVLDMDPTAPGFAYADTAFQVSTTDIETALAVAMQVRPDAVMTLASDMPIRTVAAVGEVLGLPTISPDTALNATDKGRMRERLRTHRIPVPAFHVVDNFKDFARMAGSFAEAFVVKPVDSSGSRGVCRVDGKCDLKRVYEYSKQQSRIGEVILEEFMEGPEVSVESVTVGGKTHVVAVTDKITTGDPHFVEMGHAIPSGLSSVMQEEIKNVTRAAVAALGINTGPSHTEIIVTATGPKIVEIGARLGGDNITTHLVPLATGVDMVEGCIRLSLGEAIQIDPRWCRGAAIRYMPVSPGELKSLQGVTEARAICGVSEVVFSKRVGDRITAVSSSTDRVGYVIAHASSHLGAVQLCERAMAMIGITVGQA